MKKKWITGLLALVMILSMAGCGGGEETTVTGMVVSLDGTVVSLMEMDSQMQGNFNGNRPSMSENGERPTMPEGMEDFTMPEGGFDPENLPENMPEGFDPGTFDGTIPEGMDRPEMPADGQMPSGGNFNRFEDIETTTIDLADAHISVEIEGGKEGGSLENITPGAFLTITLNGKGQATYVLVSAGMSGFGGGFTPQT